jgi:ribosomal protein L23
MPVPKQVWLPELQLALVRRATARLPRNTFVFRTQPKWTKPEIRQFLEKAYGVNVVRIATVNYGRECVDVCGKGLCVTHCEAQPDTR